MEFNEQEFVKDMTTAAFGAMFKCYEEVWCPAGKERALDCPVKELAIKAASTIDA